jgi:hypothetical protein
MFVKAIETNALLFVGRRSEMGRNEVLFRFINGFQRAQKPILKLTLPLA